ncbi:hypothetical protein C2S53_004135 [Perilla frutescens var. hirtella]|uniref:GRF-type domain-containing protein n=1 Tax=Perilla frutescens var. hirtella TaxID=608512 RepID=A0AAD4JLQ3_PERFH|nr:hypothetical protein C2S53_004135 [Perilla frutescens var. hirtella]
MVTLAADSTTTTSSTDPSTMSGNSVVCHHHGVGERYISGTDANPFRRFVRCPQRKVLMNNVALPVAGCNFFKWVDDELTPHYLTFIQRLKQQKEFLESQLQYKTVLTDVLYEKIKLKRRADASNHMKETAEKTSKPFIFFVVAIGGVLIIALLMINELI